MVQTQAQHAGGRQDVVLRRDETAAGQSHKYVHVISVPDRRSRSLAVVVVGRINNLGTGILEWGGRGEQ
jgi:hypothetical protein